MPPSSCVYGTLPRPHALHAHGHPPGPHGPPPHCYTYQEDLTRQRSIANIGKTYNDI